MYRNNIRSIQNNLNKKDNYHFFTWQRIYSNNPEKYFALPEVMVIKKGDRDEK